MTKRILSLLIAIVIIASMVSAFCVGTYAASYSTAVSVNENGYYTITNIAGNMKLNVYGSKNGNNVNVNVYQNDGTSGQLYTFVKYGNGYIIIPLCAPGRAINVYGTTAKNNANVCIWARSGHSTQLWYIEYDSRHNGYIIRSVNNRNYVLTSTGKSNSSNVCLKKYDPNNVYQVWRSDAFSAQANNELSVNKSVGRKFNENNFLQVSGAWCYSVYNNSYIRDSGCGILSIVNAVYNCTGNFINPDVVASWAYNSKYFNQSKSGGGGICNNKVFSKAAEVFGNTYGFKYIGSGKNINTESVKRHLMNGGTLIAHVPGHYITLVDYDASTGMYKVFDSAPGSGTSYNSIKRRGLTSPKGDWKTYSQLSCGNLKIDGYWMFSAK